MRLSCLAYFLFFCWNMLLRETSSSGGSIPTLEEQLLGGEEETWALSSEPHPKTAPPDQIEARWRSAEPHPNPDGSTELIGAAPMLNTTVSSVCVLSVYIIYTIKLTKYISQRNMSEYIVCTIYSANTVGSCVLYALRAEYSFRTAW